MSTNCYKTHEERGWALTVTLTLSANQSFVLQSHGWGCSDHRVKKIEQYNWSVKLRYPSKL